MDDTLQVGADRIAGEDPRIGDVRAATSAGELTAAGVGWILVEHGTPGDVDPRLLMRRDAGVVRGMADAVPDPG